MRRFYPGPSRLPDAARSRRCEGSGCTLSLASRASGGIGRRAGFRILSGQPGGGSTPPSPTYSDLRRFVSNRPRNPLVVTLVVTPW